MIQVIHSKSKKHWNSFVPHCRSHNSLSLTILTGWLLSVTHFMRCSLFWWWVEVYVNNKQYIYQNLGLVWIWCEYLTGCLPFRVKSDQIELLHSGACLPATSASTALLLKQWSAWCLRLAVEASSFESWKDGRFSHVTCTWEPHK